MGAPTTRRIHRPYSHAPTLLILGPVALRDAGGADVPLGGALPRRLLAGLALRAGELLSPDTLADIVWGETPPRSARHNLNTYLWSLRRLLERAGGQVRIEARTGGYLLSAGPGALDWHCFRDLAAAAAGVAPGDPAAAEELLRQALGLWRGAAGADLDDGPPSVAARIEGMNEARLAASEQRMEAGLAAGLHRELTGELAELTAAHPLREHVHAQLMVALYRSGRRAEALAAFQRLHRNLAGELGVDPSPPLIALRETILRAQPLAGWPLVQASAPGGGTAPVGLTAQLRDTTLGQRAAAEEARLFQGRAAELARVRNLLADAGRLPRVVELHGPPGIGKTAFAYALARECESRGWPAVILDSRDFGHDPVVLAQTIAARCGEARAPAPDHPLLLVLDTAEEMRDIEHDLWERTLPGLSGPVLVMLCGRRPTPALARSAGWRGLVDQIELPALSPAASRRLVCSLGVRDRACVDGILDFGRGNPLFLTVAAQYAWSVGDAASSPELAAAPGASASGEQALASTAARSLVSRMTREIADPRTRNLLEAASLVRTFNEELLAAMLGRDVSESFPALCGLSFVRDTPAGARVHDLVRESVAADLGWRAPQACRDLRQRAYAYLAGRANSAADAGPLIQELLHLAADCAPRARFYAPADHPKVYVRPVRPDELPRLIELCHTGITGFGFPPAERARQLISDFPVARQHFAVALDEAGTVTGFAYTLRLNRDTWRIAARTRQAFFDALPGPEREAIETAPAASRHACVVAGPTYLPGHDHVKGALKQRLFAQAFDHRTVQGNYVAYHLLTADAPDLPEILAAGHTLRAKDIPVGGYLADEWLISFGHGGLIGWIGAALGCSGTEPVISSA